MPTIRWNDDDQRWESHWRHNLIISHRNKDELEDWLDEMENLNRSDGIVWWLFGCVAVVGVIVACVVACELWW